MKKILSILLFITLLVGMVSSTTFAETEIKGLDENLDELLMRNYFTQEELAEMENAYMEFYSDLPLIQLSPGDRKWVEWKPTVLKMSMRW